MTEMFLNEENIKNELAKRNCYAKIIFKEVTGSTNSDLKELAKDGAENNTVVIALSQTNGRGRLGRTFVSEKGSGIFLSQLIKINSENIVSVTSAVAVLVYEAILKVAGVKTQIKWVNDIIVNDKKVCGILAEAVRNEKNELIGVVVGIGINIRNSLLPKEITDIAIALDAVADEFSVDSLISELICGFSKIDKMIENRDYINVYRDNSYVLGKDIKVIGKETRIAKAISIDDFGGLCVRYETGETETVFTGEVSIRIN